MMLPVSHQSTDACFASQVLSVEPAPKFACLVLQGHGLPQTVQSSALLVLRALFHLLKKPPPTTLVPLARQAITALLRAVLCAVRVLLDGTAPARAAQIPESHAHLEHTRSTRQPATVRLVWHALQVRFVRRTALSLHSHATLPVAHFLQFQAFRHNTVA